MVLFGNKSDLPKEEWKVTEQEIKNAEEKYKLKYFETSAKSNKNLNEGFSYIVNSAYSKLKGNENLTIDLNDKPEQKSGCFGKKKKTTNKNKKKNSKQEK